MSISCPIPDLRTISLAVHVEWMLQGEVRPRVLYVLGIWEKTAPKGVHLGGQLINKGCLVELSTQKASVAEFFDRISDAVLLDV